MTSTAKSLVRRAALAGLLVVAAGPAAAVTPSLAPHLATYKLSLSKLHADQGILQASGQIEYELTEGCDGWTVQQRTRLILSNSQGYEMVSGWTFRAWESKDGLTYRFYTQRLLPNGEQEEVRGKARLEGPGLGGVVTYSQPEERREDLPPGTVFPAHHGQELIEAAVGDQLLMWRDVFDGSNSEGLFGINAALLKALPAEPVSSFDSPVINGVESWRFRLAFFGPNDEGAEPNYEQGQRLYANGVVDQLEFDYQDFTLDGALQSLESLPPPDCP